MSNDTSNFDYFGSLDQNTVKEQQKADKEASGQGKHVTWEGGLKRFRFYFRVGSIPFMPRKVHWVTDPETRGRFPIICRQLAHEECPGCDFCEELKATGSAEDAKYAEDMRQSFDYIANVEDQDEPNSIKILPVRFTLHKALMGGAKDKAVDVSVRARYGDFCHRDTGYLVECIKHDAIPWYTAAPAMDIKTGQIIRAPAKRELGPKLFDLQKEVVIPPLDFWKRIIGALRNGTALFPKDDKKALGWRPGAGQGGNAPALGNRQAPSTEQARGPSIQETLDKTFEKGLFDPT